MKNPLHKLAACRLLPLMLWPLASLALAQQHAHTHGMIALDVAVDAQTITLSMEAPLDSFLGFERAPRTEAERKSVDAMVRRLHAAESLFAPDPKAECRLSKVTLASSVLGLPDADKPAAATPGAATSEEAAHDGHADIDVTMVFSCAKAPLARHIDIRLFDAFARLRTIDAQVASAQGQFKRRLTKAAPRLTWGR